MRGLRSTLMLLVVLLGLGAYVYFVEWKRPSPSDAGATGQKALAIPQETIEQLTIKSESGDTTTVTKADGSWQIIAPVAAGADEAAIARMTSSLSGLEIRRVVDDNPSDLRQFGLDPPRVEVTVKASGDRDEKRLLIGEKTPTGGGMYARLASDRKLFLIAADLDGTFNRSTFDLRDKAVVKVEREKIDALEIVAANHTVGLVKNGTDWDMKQPIQTRADFGVVTELISKLTSLQMSAVVAPEATDPARYGLEVPVCTVTIGAGSSRATLHIGTTAGESTTYARDASRPVVFTIDSSLASDLMKGPGELRRKDVFEFQAFDASRLELTRDGQTTIYEKVKGTGTGPQEPWRELSPSARDIDASTMEAALSKLSYLRAVSFVDPKKTRTALEYPAFSVLVKYEDNKKEERVRLAQVGSTPFAARADWPDAATLDATAYTLLTNALDALKK